MAHIVDARGLPCPQPVILTRKALEAHPEVTTIVDSDTSRENVTRMAQKAGHAVEVERREDGTYIHIRKGGQPAPEPQSAAQAPEAPPQGPLVLLVPSEHFGRGDAPELGTILMRGFFHTLGEVQPRPQRVIFLNSGVKLVVQGSPVLEDLQALAAEGVEILACGTCLNYFGLMDQVAVGEVSNMYAIAEALLQAGKVVSL
ncbi:MAG: sulfurtransferase-like selenium metabolism protein YedF [Anaerolineae bacterium]|nr:sulfurtransferase-like selenium metabolism protein YedF [Anaerolineae bacterium]